MKMKININYQIVQEGGAEGERSWKQQEST